MQNCKSSERKKLENKKTKLGETNAKLYDVINELNTLSTSTQVYDIIEDKSYNDSGNAIGYGAKDNSVTKYNPKTGIVEIRLGNTTDEMVAHELKHAYQFEVGELVSNAKGWVEEYYGQDKEQAAYDRQALFSIRLPDDYMKKYSHLPEKTYSIGNKIYGTVGIDRQLKNYAKGIIYFSDIIIKDISLK